MRRYLSVIAACVGLLLSCSAAPAWDASRKQQYPSPDLNTPNVDRLIIRGTGSTGEASTFSVSPSADAPNGSLGKFLAVPTFSRGTVKENRQSSPTTSDGGFVYQNREVSASDILGPQQPPSYFTHDGIRSTVVNMPDSKAQTTSAFGFYVRNDSPNKDATGVFGTSVCAVDNCSAWGLNPTVIDHTANGVVTNGQNRHLIGMEINPSVTSSGTTLQGISILGSSFAQPKFAAAFTVGHLKAANPGEFKWNYAFGINDGAAATGFLIGAQAVSGTNVPGTQNLFNYIDATGAVRAVVMNSSPSGGLNIGGTAAANGIAMQPAAAGQFPEISTFGVDPNPGLVLRAQGTGQVIAQSLLSAAKGLYVEGSARVTGLLRLRAYTVAELPACNSDTVDAIAAVVNANNPQYRAAVVGGGGSRTTVYCDGGGVWTTN
ncbi:hypothetical protein AX289_27265 [Methylorubrum populi]|nr:hypothetical protein AX289_27265 [Methylorubrum populi]